jgi:hippurate hydrolase
MMASFDCFEITITGQATHAAMPHLGNDVIVIAAQVINALQTIVSRTLDPAHPAVVSITQIHAGHTWNALPESAVLRGTFRCFDAAVKTSIAHKIEHLVHTVCASFGATATLSFNPENQGYPVALNSAPETQLALQAAIAVAGEHCINPSPTPSMGSEDFAFMLQEKPGCYIWIGNGPSVNSCLLHNPNYDFNDEILPIGAAYWVKLVELLLK